MIIAVHDPAARRLAIEALSEQRPVVVPTETVYGLAVEPTGRLGLDRIVALKNRAVDKPMAVLAESLASAMDLAVLHPSVEAIVATVWPGPLTVVAERQPGVAFELGGDASSIGVRCPDLDWLRSVISETGPIAATSANRSGEAPVTTAAAAAALFGENVLVVDGGTITGEPSTIVDVRAYPPVLLRAGPVTVAW